MIAAPAPPKKEGEPDQAEAAKEAKPAEVPKEEKKEGDAEGDAKAEAKAEESEENEQFYFADADEPGLDRLNSFVEGRFEENEPEDTTGTLEEYKHSIKDLNAKKNRVILAHDKRVKSKMIMQKVLLNKCQEKRGILKIIREALDKANTEQCTKFILYYVGHGHEEFGGWVTYLPEHKKTNIVNVDKQIVGIKEILEILNHSEFQNDFELTSESCFSGEICHQAKDWIEEKRKNKDKQFRQLSITSSTFRENKGIWGEYRKFKTGMTETYAKTEDMVKAQRAYVRKLGTTKFNSRLNYTKCYQKMKNKENIFPFPIYTAFPDHALFPTQGDKVDPEIKKKFIAQFWKKDAE